MGPTTLLICISYSGNTWETLELLRKGRLRGAQTIGITSGGRLAALGKEQAFPVVLVPGGMQPRAALPALLCSALQVLVAAGLVKNTWKTLPSFLADNLEKAEDTGKELAELLWGKHIIVYSSVESVARRFKTQVNENAKLPCRMDVLPELNHNETVGWAGAGKDNAVVLFRVPEEPEMLKKAVEFLKTVVAGKATVAEILPEGRTALERALFSIMVGDFASYYLGVKGGVDTEQVEVIRRLKETIGENNEKKRGNA